MQFRFFILFVLVTVFVFTAHASESDKGTPSRSNEKLKELWSKGRKPNAKLQPDEQKKSSSKIARDINKKGEKLSKKFSKKSFNDLVSKAKKAAEADTKKDPRQSRNFSSWVRKARKDRKDQADAPARGPKVDVRDGGDDEDEEL